MPEPKQIDNTQEPFSMLATTLNADNYLGRLLTGRIESGILKSGQMLKALDINGNKIENFRVSKILAFRGLKQQPIELAEAGDIVSIAGMSKANVSDTLSDLSVNKTIPSQPIDPPTITVTFGINDSPLAGRDGSKLQSRVIRERLLKECESNIAIKMQDVDKTEKFDVSGRGELQLGILIENMRREGFELSISRPRVVYKHINGIKNEPIEEVTIDVDEEYSGSIIEKLSTRKGSIIEMKPSGKSKTRIVALVPSRGLIGYHGEFMTDTRGTGVLNRIFHSWEPFKGSIPGRRQGVLISMESGKSVAYAIFNLEDRGRFFIGAGEEVYQGMVIGEHTRDNDLDVNPLKGKKLTNVRASGSDEAVKLTTPVRMNLEQAISYINDDELVEVTPTNIRLRKVFLIHTREKEIKR